MSEARPPYPEPNPILASPVRIGRIDATLVALETVQGVPLEIEFMTGIGWSLEVRYDSAGNGVIRQPFTGEQGTVMRSSLNVTVGPGTITIAAGEHQLVIDRGTATFEYRAAETVVWRSAGCPFWAHTTPVRLREDIQSIEYAGLEEPTPWRPHPAFFETTMARFRYPAPPGPILGLPGQTGEFNRRGYRFELHNNDQPLHLPSRPPMYQSWPIVFHPVVSGTGWCGVFHDNPSRTFVDLGDFYPETVAFESITNNTRVYIVTAETLSGVTNRLVGLLGTPVFPPAWAFGYQQCRYSYMSTDEVRRVATALRERAIPCDAIYFDIDYMDGYRVFTRNRETFSDLERCLVEIGRVGFRSVCIVDPGVKAEVGYPVYDRFVSAGAVLTDGNGEPFTIVCWPGKAVLPDFLSAAARAIWAELIGAWLKEFPFDGVWNDMNEPANFDGGRERTSTAHSTAGPLRSLYNLYGGSMAEATAHGVSAARSGERSVVITRAGYPGVQKHSVIWHGDNHGWWEHLRLAIDTAITYALCGAFYTGPDVPGFFGNPPEDLAVRFFQLGAFLPLFRGHSFKLARSKEPYAFSESANERIKAAIELRYSLVSEWYTGFEQAVSEGRPPLEPVFGADGAPIRDTFLLFGKLLVAPVTERDTQARAVWLPPGEWYRLGAGHERILGERWLLEAVTLDSIPVFVRAGTILVRHEPRSTVAETLKTEPRFEIYRDSAGGARGRIYADDGVSVNDGGATWYDLTIGPGELTPSTTVRAAGRTSAAPFPHGAV